MRSEEERDGQQQLQSIVPLPVLLLALFSTEALWSIVVMLLPNSSRKRTISLVRRASMLARKIRRSCA